jgi:uncharacterized protein with GYD domain
LIEALGGKLHHLFFSFGDYDVVALCEMPDDKSMTAGSMAIAGPGAFSGGKITKLMSATDAMAAMTDAQKVTWSYTPATG